MARVAPAHEQARELEVQVRDPCSVITASVQATVQLGPVSFVLAWAGIYGLHAICAAYFVLAAQLYARLPGTQVSNTVQLYQLAVEQAYFYPIASTHYVLAAMHMFFLVKPLLSGLRKAIIADVHQSRIKRSLYERFRSGSAPLMAPAVKSPYPRVAALFQQIASAFRTVFARDGIFGVHNPHFETVFLTREVIETLLQTYQAYAMSRLLPRVWLNGFYTIILVVNCWTMPLLRRVYRKNRAMERLLAVLCDIALDFVSSIAVPVIVAMTYLAVYDRETTDFSPWTLTYDDVWLINFINEAPLVLLSSWLDGISRLIFSLGLLISLEDVKALITRHGRDLGAKTHGKPSEVLTQPRPAGFDDPKLEARISKWVYRAMITWGITILGTYLDAYFRSPPDFCALPLRPWFVQDPACGVVRIDCAKHGISASGQDNQAIFGKLDSASVEYVVYRHCPRIEFPSQLLAFKNLYGIKTYNSTIARWDDDAALMQKAHPRARFAFLVRTHFPDNTLPPGLLHPAFPVTLSDIEICVSNIKWLPATLPWRVDTVFLEYSQLDTFPLQLLQLSPTTMSLAYNRISDFPPQAITTPLIARLALLGNPIAELPKDGVDIAPLLRHEPDMQLYLVSLEYTRIASLPDWVTQEFVDQVFFLIAGTPLCTRTILNASSLERELLLAERPWLTSSCEMESGVSSFYPLDVEDDDQ